MVFKRHSAPNNNKAGAPTGGPTPGSAAVLAAYVAAHPPAADPVRPASAPPPAPLSIAERDRAYNQALILAAADLRRLTATPAPGEKKNASPRLWMKWTSRQRGVLARAPTRGSNEMNSQQRIAVMIGIGAAVLLALFPPWHMTPRGVDISCGYSFIAVPAGDNCGVDFGRMLIEWAAVGGATAIYLVFRR
jgi:hypothetical protein